MLWLFWFRTTTAQRHDVIQNSWCKSAVRLPRDKWFYRDSCSGACAQNESQLYVSEDEHIVTIHVQERIKEAKIWRHIIYVVYTLQATRRLHTTNNDALIEPLQSLAIASGGRSWEFTARSNRFCNRFFSGALIVLERPGNLVSIVSNAFDKLPILIQRYISFLKNYKMQIIP